MYTCQKCKKFELGKCSLGIKSILTKIEPTCNLFIFKERLKNIKEVCLVAEGLKMYKCVKSFLLEEVDEDGFTIDGKYTHIEEGSTWYIPEDEDYRLIDGEIRLESDEFGWIEITKETLEQNFETIF